MSHVPLKLGPYEPLHRLGAGGMAETFAALRRGPGGFEQRVCIKRVLPAYAMDSDFVRSFLAEARTSAALRHANVVQVLDFGIAEEDGSHYLALELIDGLDLRGLLQQDAPFDAELVTLIAAELAAALEHAHSPDEGRAPVIHRDVSPSNVLVSRAGELKLTDFGIARAVGSAHRTASGVIKGKVPYMPPEYIEHGRFDARGDLFALGVLLFELLHGERPFDGESEIDTMRRIAAGDRRPFTADVPAPLASCIERLIARDADARFASATALLDALPSVAVHSTRRRLAELVRARTSLSPRASQSPALTPASVAPTEPFSPSERPRSLPPLPPTQTTLRPPTWLPSRHALLTLLGSASLLLIVSGALIMRGTPRAAEAAPPPRLPEVPAKIVATAPPARELLVTTAPAPSASDAGAAPLAIDAPAPLDPGASPPVVSTTPSPPAGAPATREPTRSPAMPASPKHGELRVVVYPFGEIWLDDKYIGYSPRTLQLKPGPHDLGIGEGRPSEHRTIQVEAGQHEQVILQLPRRPR